MYTFIESSSHRLNRIIEKAHKDKDNKYSETTIMKSDSGKGLVIFSSGGDAKKL